jgi:hypothetical protein
MCGSDAEVFATGTSECYGWAWQTYGVCCKDDNKQHCDMEVSVVADYSYLDMHDATVIELWNAVVALKK